MTIALSTLLLFTSSDVLRFVANYSRFKFNNRYIKITVFDGWNRHTFVANAVILHIRIVLLQMYVYSNHQILLFLYIDY
jgi:hypothetical protein